MIEIRKNEEEELDEVVAKNCTIHAEKMDKKQWHVQIIDKAQNSLSLEIYGELFVPDGLTRDAQQRDEAEPSALKLLRRLHDTCPTYLEWIDDDLRGEIAAVLASAE